MEFGNRDSYGEEILQTNSKKLSPVIREFGSIVKAASAIIEEEHGNAERLGSQDSDSMFERAQSGNASIE